MVTKIDGTMMNGSYLAERYIADHPGTTLSKNAIRRILRSGVVGGLELGRQRFYSYEGFCEFLITGNIPAASGTDM